MSNIGVQVATDLLFQGAMSLWPDKMTAEVFNQTKADILSRHCGASISMGEMKLSLYRVFCEKFGVPS